MQKLNGLVLSSIEGFTEGSPCVTLTTTDNKVYLLHHHQDCCESVSLLDWDADPQLCLLGSPLSVEVKTEVGTPEESDDYLQWTFITLFTIKGRVTLRWIGETNSCYAVDVDCDEYTPDSDD